MRVHVRDSVGLLIDRCEALEEEQREDVLLVVAGVDQTAQEVGRAPEDDSSACWPRCSVGALRSDIVLVLTFGTRLAAAMSSGPAIGARRQ